MIETINWIQITVETLLLIVGFAALYWKNRIDAEHRFTKLETMVFALSKDHENLDEKVGRISRTVAEIKGYLDGKK